MPESQERRSFLFSLTLTELAFLMFFLLLLLALTQLGLRDDDRTVVTTLRDIRGFEGLEQRILENDHDFVELVRAPLEAVLSSTDAERLERLTRLIEADDLQASGAQPCADEGVKLEQANQNLRGQLENVRRRCGRGGLDYPPCWADPNSGAIDYIYDVTLREESIDVARSWRDSRDQAARAIPGALELVGVGHTIQRFSDRADPVLAWSNASDCRHYVRIYDGAVTKDGFKRTLLTVEDFFYKYLVREYIP